MNRIVGLNDKRTLNNRPQKPSITIWKGTKKTSKSAGRNLEESFRIESPASLRKALSTSYKTQISEGSIFVTELNLVPAFEDECQAFTSKMTAFTASRPLLFCDRQTINTKFLETKSQNGDVYIQPTDTSEPCPVAGTNFACPNKCTRTGDFYFYIYELLLLGYNDLARLQVHGVADNQHIASYLDQVKKDIGAIKKSPFVSEETRQYIIYQMSRRKVSAKFPVKEGGKRTAKRGSKDDWVISLKLHPIWQRRYDYHRQAQSLIAADYQPSHKLIEQVHGEGLISPGLSQKQLLPENKLEAFKSKLAIAYKNNGWNKEGWTAMMLENFKTTSISDDLDLELLLAIANSPEEKSNWCNSQW